MTIHDFFSFSGEHTSYSVQAHAPELDTTPDLSEKNIVESDHDRLIIGDYTSLHFPILYKQEYGSKWDDMLNTGWPSLYLISDKIKLILEENKLTGWKTFPINLFDKKGNKILGYHGFSITGRCGPIDYGKCEIIEKRKPSDSPILRKFYKGLYVGLDQWDGSDFFQPKGDLEIIVTSKTAEIFKKNKISNVFLENLANVEIDEGTVKLAEKKIRL